ncbi:hypothetical protein [Kitasatospora purpeofusca]|uniref:hypothetical protein n=1 Tax=Kitasatospora purpeofusca TaxID=67352 RepID=UPI0036D2CBA6
MARTRKGKERLRTRKAADIRTRLGGCSKLAEKWAITNAVVNAARLLLEVLRG